MFFVFFRTTVTARSGLRTFELPFTCEHCHKVALARVVADGVCAISKAFGSPNHAVAQQGAERNALTSAQRALAASPCPYCHKFASDLTRRRDAEQAEDNLKDQRRWPWTIRAATATFVLFLIGAIYDRSGWLAGAAVGAATFAGAITLIALSQLRSNAPLTQPPSVQFFAAPNASGYRESMGGPLQMAPPVQTGPARRAQSPSALAMIAAALGAFAFMGAAMMWIRTFTLLHVVNTDGVEMTVWVDEKPRGVISPHPDGKEAAAEKYVVRPGNHTVRVESARAKPPAQSFDVTTGSKPFVYAPSSHENGECVVLETGVYSAKGSAGGSKNVHAPTELWELPARPDPEYVWKPLPSSVDLQNNETKTLTALRLTPCSRSPSERDP